MHYIIKKAFQKERSMTPRELALEIIDIMDEMAIDLKKSHLVKKAAQRARVKSLLLEKMFKKFRKVSLKIDDKKIEVSNESQNSFF
jgi:hypothetical protein